MSKQTTKSSLKISATITREDMAVAETLMEIVAKKRLEILDLKEYKSWLRKIMGIDHADGPYNKVFWPKTYAEYKTIARKVISTLPESYGIYEEFHKNKELIDLLVAEVVCLTLFYKEKLDEEVKKE